MRKVAVILGTRPEAIKLLPIYSILRRNELTDVELISTGQHKEMLEQVFNLFKVSPKIDLNVMLKGQSLSELTGKIFLKLGAWIDKSKPDMIVVQGDTTTAMAAALIGFYNKIPLAHVEAGLRTYNRFSPFPEEINRQIIGNVADYHFAPTQKSYEVLVKEGKEKVFMVGNTVIDSLFSCLHLINEKIHYINTFKEVLLPGKRNVLITCHRRESFGDGIKNICEAIKIISQEHSDLNYIFPVHMNPNVSKTVNNVLDGINNVKILSPLKYDEIVYVLNNSILVLTDSGGVQEEAPALNIPVLVLRDTTEREEGVESGCSRLVGTDSDTIVNQVNLLLKDEIEYQKMANSPNPYGDGKAAERIADYLFSIL